VSSHIRPWAGDGADVGGTVTPVGASRNRWGTRTGFLHELRVETHELRQGWGRMGRLLRFNLSRDARSAAGGGLSPLGKSL